MYAFSNFSCFNFIGLFSYIYGQFFETTRLFDEYYSAINEYLHDVYGWEGCFKTYEITPVIFDNMDSWEAEKKMFKKQAEEYRREIQENFYNKVKEKCGSIDDKTDRLMVDMLVDYFLSQTNMGLKELQQAYSQRIDKIAEYKTASDEKEKESIMQSFTDMCKPEPIPTTTMNNDGYTQSDYSDIPDDWEQIIFEDIENILSLNVSSIPKI